MAIGFVSSVTNRSSGGVSSHGINKTGVTAGNLLVLYVGTFQELTPGSSTVSGGGATWSRRSIDGPTNNINTQVWEGRGGTGGSITVTYTPGGSNAEVAVILAEFNSADASAPFDQEAGITGSSNQPDSGVTGTLAQSDSLKVSACAHDGGNITMVPRAGDGDTQLTGQLNGNTGMVIGGSYQILSATTAVRGRWTLGASQNWACSVTIFKAAAGGGGTTVTPPAGAMALTGQQPSMNLTINIPTDTI